MGIAQPTVSQQIARIEKSLEGRVFQRVGKQIHITPLGQQFYVFAHELVEKADAFSNKLKDQSTHPSGLVRYAMPESCQWTPHYRRIMSQIREFPNIKFDIQILPNQKITELLLEGKLDFAFVTGERLKPEFRFEKFSNEEYALVAADKKLFLPVKERKLNELRLIGYPGWEMFASTWFSVNGLWPQMKKVFEGPKVKVGSLSGAIHAVQEGAGAAVIPTHCVVDELKNRTLFALDSEKGKVPSQPVHIVRRTGEGLSKRAELVLNMLRMSTR